MGKTAASSQKSIVTPGDDREDDDVESAKPVVRHNPGISPEKRPLVGKDVADYKDANMLERTKVVEALALPSPGAYTRLIAEQNIELPYQLELLMRFYMKQPPVTPKILPIQVFENIYGDLLAKFDKKHVDAARVMLYDRFANMLGRTVYSSYRWFKRNDSGRYGEANAPLRKLFALLPTEPKAMRRELEGLARKTMEMRGIILDQRFPLPDPKHPPVARKPGPAPGVSSKRAQVLAEEVVSAIRKSGKTKTEPKAGGKNTPLKALKKAVAQG